MYPALSPGAVGVNIPDLGLRLSSARRYGFHGVEISPDEVQTLGPEQVLKTYDAAGVVPCGWGLPVDWRTTDESWREGLERLPEQARAMSDIGCQRVSTWVLPGSNDRDLASNRPWHVERFRPIAQILGEHGCRLGLEFIGPKTLRSKFTHEFLYRMHDMLDMAREIGPNVGLLVDAWHWYTSGGTQEDLSRLTSQDVVYVHVNDAPAGVGRDEQVDNVRELPGETGVIDIAGFLRGLRNIGYDGPVVPEPFKADLKDLPSDEARLAAVGASMKRIFDSALG